MLVDSGNARLLGVLGIAEGHLLPIQVHNALLCLMYPRNHLDKGGFPRPIFPH